MEALSDNSLMLKVKAGEVQRLALLYERYNRDLFGYFYRLTGNSATSEDMVQNVFYRMIRYSHTYRGEGDFIYWMYRIARNVWADSFRRKNPLAKTKDLASIENHSDEERNPHQSLEASEGVALLRKALARLAPEKQEAIILSRFQGLKYKEIAKITESTENTIKSRIHRGLIELKEIMNQWEMG